MIELDVKEYCQNCPDFEPHSIELVSGFKNIPIATKVVCVNRERCEMIEKFIRKELNTKEKNYGKEI